VGEGGVCACMLFNLSGYACPSSVVILSMSCGLVPASTTFSRECERKGSGAPFGRSSHCGLDC
jgi:hypothetical protein